MPIITVHYKDDCVAFDHIELFMKWMREPEKHKYFNPIYKYQVQDVRFGEDKNDTINNWSLDRAVYKLKSENFNIEIIPGG
jgi:hypothetical protein